MLLAGACLSACATSAPQRSGVGQGGQKIGPAYQVAGVWYRPRAQPNYDQVGTAAWYGEAYHNKATASGERFDMNAMTAAHTTLPLPSMVEVTNLDNGRKAVVRVNDRGPFTHGRIIDLSRGAARELGYDRQGLARVRVRYLGPPGADPDRRIAAPPAPPTMIAAPPAPMFRPTSPPIAAAPLPAPPSEQLAPFVPREQLPDSRPTPDRVIESPLAPPPLATGSPPFAAFRIQVGAFGDPANARRAAEAVTAAGRASIEPMARDDQTLYRVFLPAPSDEAEAFAIRDHVAALGFVDAMVVRPAGL